MNTASDEMEEMRKSILALIRELIIEISSENENPMLYRSGFLTVLAEEEKILSQDRMDLARLKMDNFGIFRTVTDNDFQHTPLGKRFLDLTRMVSLFITKKSEA